MIMFQLPKTIISYSSLTQKLFDVISVYLAFVVACAARPARIFTNNVIASSIHIHVRLKQGFYIAGCARWPLFDDAILEYVYASGRLQYAASRCMDRMAIYYIALSDRTKVSIVHVYNAADIRTDG